MRRRILFLTNGLFGGGAERVLQTLLYCLDKNKYEVCLIAVSGRIQGSGYPDWISKDVIFKDLEEISKHSFPLRWWFLLLNRTKYLIYQHFHPRFFYRLFIPKEFDIEIAFLEGYATRILSGSINRSSRKIAWVHIDLAANHWTDIAYRSREEEAEAYAHFDKVVCVSESVKRSMRTINPDLESMVVLYNPIDDDAIRLQSHEPFMKNGFLKGAINLVTLGRLVPQKGYDRLLQILKRLHDGGLEFVINILGEGPDRALLERMISDMDMKGYVSLMGYMQNPYPYLRSSDLFVCSSRSEGYSTAVTEALILGVPVITTDCSGMEELLYKGKYGLIVKNEDSALYDGLKMLMSDSILLNDYRKKAEERGRFFSKTSLLSRIISLIDNY